jgi:phenylacetate-CoA ligase
MPGMPTTWLSRLFNGGGVRTHAGQNNRDSLFKLPLQPPPPDYRGKMNGAVSKLNAEVNRAVANFSVGEAQRQLAEVPEEEWIKRGERRALALFRAAAEHVPAYKDFLRKKRITPEEVRTTEKFRQLPQTNKENYLRAYPLEQLCWHGVIADTRIISFSSGSTGQPFFWPRGPILETETALEHELFLTSFFKIDRAKTIFVNCFSMGMYVAGTITLNSILQLSQKGYPLTIITPGIDIGDAIRAIPRLQEKYDQIILAGYPPFIKDILDEGLKAGVDWSTKPIKFLLAGEGYSETWRKHVAKLVGDSSDPLHDFINLYGSADAAVLAHETPTSITVRSRLAQDAESRKRLFRSDRLPTLLQYHPEHKFIEEINNGIIFTATGGIPLVRYNIGDSGGVLSREEIQQQVPALEEYFTELARHRQLWNLPFVYVFGKGDQTVMLYGLNIYPDHIKTAVDSIKVKEFLTGRFSMVIKNRENMDQYLLITLELAQGTSPTKELESLVQQEVVAVLREINREYSKLHSAIGNKAVPEIELVKTGEGELFSRQGKQKWVDNYSQS